MAKALFKGGAFKGDVFKPGAFNGVGPAQAAALLTRGLFFFSMTGIPFLRGYADYATDYGAYHPSFASTQGADTVLDSAGLQPPFVLCYVKNTGANPITVKDGVGGLVLATLKPGFSAFLIAKKTPAVTGLGTVQYCLFSRS